MKIEFEIPDGVRLCSFAFENTDIDLQFKACVAGQPIAGTDGIVRPHAIEVARGQTPQEAIDRAVECLRAREETLRNWVVPAPQRVYNKPSVALDLSVFDDL